MGQLKRARLDMGVFEVATNLRCSCERTRLSYQSLDFNDAACVRFGRAEGLSPRTIRFQGAGPARP